VAVLACISSRQYPQVHGMPGIFAFSRIVVVQHRGRRWFEAMLRLLKVHGFTEACLISFVQMQTISRIEAYRFNSFT
jgi:hypothetical protein